MWWFLLYCTALVGLWWCGSVLLSIHRIWAALVALSAARAFVLLLASVHEFWREANRIKAALPVSVSCLDLNRKGAIAQMLFASSDEISRRFVAAWNLLLVPFVAVIWVFVPSTLLQIMCTPPRD